MLFSENRLERMNLINVVSIDIMPHVVFLQNVQMRHVRITIIVYDRFVRLVMYDTVFGIKFFNNHNIIIDYDINVAISDKFLCLAVVINDVEKVLSKRVKFTMLFTAYQIVSTVFGIDGNSGILTHDKISYVIIHPFDVLIL